ncbi:MAG: hypothetical protein JWP09_237, partial [Candidatus Taylorbacteria bacterium]|nr:hypothetical protein [Candidatus Taylorbacteria bacterium]
QPPVFTKINPQPKRGSKLLKILVVVIILGAIATLAYGYSNKLWFFKRALYNTSKLASSIFAGVGNIKTSNYTLNIDVVSEPKDADAEPFKVELPTDQVKIDAYNKDLDTVRDLQSILMYLQAPYPTSLAKLETPQPINNPKITYSLVPGGKDFDLGANFETVEAREAAKKSVTGFFAGGDNSIFLNKDSGTYISIPDTLPQPQLASALNMGSYLSYIPVAFKLNATIDGKSAVNDTGSLNTDTHVTANTDLGDINVAVDVEIKKIADNFFVYVTKLPSFFIDITKLKNQWVKITPTDLSSGIGATFKSFSDVNSKSDAETKEKFKENINKILIAADKNQALISANEPVSEDINGTKAYRYDLEFNKDTLVSFYSDMTTALNDASTTPETIQSEKSALEYLKSPEFDKAFDYFRKNTTFSIWADANGTPIQVRYSVRVVPESKTSTPSTNQIKFTATLKLNDINSAINIDEPKDAMSVEDATIALSGITKEQYRFSKQLTNIRTLQSAIGTYKALTGTYPNTLADLMATRGDLKKKFGTPKIEPNIYVPSGTDEQKVLENIPVDVNSGAQYIYANKGTNYALSYQVALPKYVSGTVPSGIYTYKYETKGGTRIVMIVLDGNNTANATAVSEEADKQSLIDSDKDGLPDVLEDYIGTNKLKADTDKDGHGDKDELLSGSNPLGAGKLTGNMYSSGLY